MYILDYIGAEIRLAIAAYQVKKDPIPDDLSARLDFHFILDEYGEETLRVLRDTLGYKDDAFIAMAHAESIDELIKERKSIEEIANAESLSIEMVNRCLQMIEEYKAYRIHGIVPEIAERETIGGPLDRKYFEDLRYEVWYGENERPEHYINVFDRAVIEEAKRVHKAGFMITIFKDKQDIPQNMEYIELNNLYFDQNTIERLDGRAWETLRHIDDIFFIQNKFKYGINGEELDIDKLPVGYKTMLNVLYYPDKVFSMKDCGKRILEELYKFEKGHVCSEYAMIPSYIRAVAVQKKDDVEIISDREDLEKWWKSEN